jgi:hypothetical protein
MSLIVRQRWDGKIVLYTKGADSMMLARAAAGQDMQGHIEEHLVRGRGRGRGGAGRGGAGRGGAGRGGAGRGGAGRGGSMAGLRAAAGDVARRPAHACCGPAGALAAGVSSLERQL